jgi:hypothetical protein
MRWRQGHQGRQPLPAPPRSRSPPWIRAATTVHLRQMSLCQLRVVKSALALGLECSLTSGF